MELETQPSEIGESASMETGGIESVMLNVEVREA